MLEFRVATESEWSKLYEAEAKFNGGNPSALTELRNGLVSGITTGFFVEDDGEVICCSRMTIRDGVALWDGLSGNFRGNCYQYGHYLFREMKNWMVSNHPEVKKFYCQVQCSNPHWKALIRMYEGWGFNQYSVNLVGEV